MDVFLYSIVVTGVNGIKVVGVVYVVPHVVVICDVVIKTLYSD